MRIQWKVCLCALMLAVVGLGGCVSTGAVRQVSWQSAGIQADFDEKDLFALAEDAALRVARQYPPGEMIISLDYDPQDAFGVAFESALRSQGFRFASQHAEGTSAPATEPLKLAYIFDALSATPYGYYLYVRASDGFSFSRVYTLTEGKGFVGKGVVAQTEPFFQAQGEANQEVLHKDIKKWGIVPGGLKKQLEVWANSAGYRLVWNLDTDYQMQAGVVFNDTFTGAVKRLFARMFTSGNALRVRIYHGNKVIEVGEV